MTRASAAQEPSMDEILASIRKIIEHGNEPATSSGRPEVERLSPDQGGGSILARLRPSLGDARVASGRVDEAPRQEPGSFVPSWASQGDEDDLATRLAEELASEGLMDWASEASSRQDTPPEAVGEGSSGESSSQVAGEAFVEPQDSAPPAGLAPANSDDRLQSAIRQAVIEDALEPQTPAAAAEPLMSGLTGELVSASFEELSEAIREGHLRSIEDMAQDILRPMLQEWLDDNLPRLVERLVREEIERVARGGGRR